MLISCRLKPSDQSFARVSSKTVFRFSKSDMQRKVEVYLQDILENCDLIIKDTSIRDLPAFRDQIANVLSDLEKNK